VTPIILRAEACIIFVSLTDGETEGEMTMSDINARQDCITWHEADEIDHVTKKYRSGKGLDRTEAVKMVRYYAWRLPQMAALFPQPHPVTGDLDALSDADLVARLTAARTFLLREVFPTSERLRAQEKECLDAAQK